MGLQVLLASEDLPDLVDLQPQLPPTPASGIPISAHAKHLADHPEAKDLVDPMDPAETTVVLEALAALVLLDHKDLLAREDNLEMLDPKELLVPPVSSAQHHLPQLVNPDLKAVLVLKVAPESPAALETMDALDLLELKEIVALLDNLDVVETMVLPVAPDSQDLQEAATTAQPLVWHLDIRRLLIETVSLSQLFYITLVFSSFPPISFC
jgi:hypothetical protein